MTEYSRMTGTPTCPKEGYLSLAERNSYDFFLDLSVARQHVANNGEAHIPEALLFMTRGERVAPKTYAQMRQCFERIAEGNCPNFQKEQL